MVEEIVIDFSGKYYEKYLEVNAEIKKESDEGIDILQDLINDGELTEIDLLEKAYSDISIDELKRLILGFDE